MSKKSTKTKRIINKRYRILLMVALLLLGLLFIFLIKKIDFLGSNTPQQKISRAIEKSFPGFHVTSIETKDTSYSSMFGTKVEQFEYTFRLSNDSGYCALSGIQVTNTDPDYYFAIDSSNEINGNATDIYNYNSTDLVISKRARDNLIRLVNSNKYCDHPSIFTANSRPIETRATEIFKSDLQKSNSRNIDNYYFLFSASRVHIYYLDGDNWISIN